MSHEQQEAVQVKALRVFEIGDERIEAGDTITVSATRASYLSFLGLAEKS
jgi:hypothetical protein